MKKYFAVAAACLVILAVSAFAQKAGKHSGEVKQLDVEIIFSRPSGTTVCNSNGTYFCYGGRTYFEPKVYPSAYWGEYELYFYGNPVYVTVRVTNKGPRAKAKLRITTEAYELLTSGASGDQIMMPKDIDVELGKGETKVIDATFTSLPRTTPSSGLDRFLVKVAHINNGGGPGNPDPALIMVKEGVFCPPAP